MPSSPQITQPGWNAENHPDLAVEQRFDEDGQPTVTTLSHPDLPFVRRVAPAQPGALQGVADEYLQAVARLAIFTPPLPAIGTADDGFGWLDVAWGGPDSGAQAAVDPRLSFWVGRNLGDDGTPAAATLVLLAGNRHRGADGRQRCEGGSVGLRVVMHVAQADKQGLAEVRVTSMSASGWLDARPAGVPLPAELAGPHIEAARQAVARTMGFDPAHTAIHSALLRGQGDDAVLELSGVSIRHSSAAQDKRLCTWSTKLEMPLPDRAQPLRCRSSWLALQASAMARRPLHRASPRDGLDDAGLQRAARRLGGSAGQGGRGGSRRPAGPARFEVLRPTLDEPADPPVPVRKLPDRLARAKLNDVACAHAVERADELFSRLDAWGLRPEHSFKLARLPLKMMPRAGFRFQPDGLTTNAMVQATAPGPGFDQPFDPDRRPQLEVRFGVTSTTRGERVATAAGDLRTEYRSLAADPRWAWHEFAHVLQFASTGELEFRFAHSVGDALAAIVSDPALPMGDAALRGATFPASRLPRRHDRPALQGWCWCGERSRLRRVAGRDAPLLFGGYFEEQLMSSSLFRLYQAAGGDTPDGPASHPAGKVLAASTRRRAAEAVLYLIVRAIQLLGPATLVPAVTPAQFVTALVDADIGTERWTAGEGYDGNGAEKLGDRLGGTLHKVIRWAFEQQGLYAADAGGGRGDVVRDIVRDIVREGPGLPPAVDLYIPGSGERAGGDYHPVPLLPASDDHTPPGWHTDADALWVDDKGLNVKVGNRGRMPATAVRLQAWSRKPGRSTAAWRPLGRPVQLSGEVKPGSLRTVTVGPSPGPGRHEVLVMVSGRGDLSNLDLQSRLPCAAASPPRDAAALMDLLAGDNNLAMRCIRME
jgi:hypothetical protein